MVKYTFKSKNKNFGIAPLLNILFVFKYTRILYILYSVKSDIWSAIKRLTFKKLKLFLTLNKNMCSNQTTDFNCLRNNSYKRSNYDLRINIYIITIDY